MAKRQVKWQRTISLHPYSSMRSNDPRTLRGHEKIHANLTEHLGQPIDAWMARTPPPRPWTIGEWTITLHLFLAHGSSVMLRVERTSIADRAERDAAAPAGFTRNVRIAFPHRAPYPADVPMAVGFIEGTVGLREPRFPAPLRLQSRSYIGLLRTVLLCQQVYPPPVRRRSGFR